jgi:hypothetical protein
MSFFVTSRQRRTGSNRFDKPYDAIAPEVIEISDTKEIEFREADAG